MRWRDVQAARDWIAKCTTGHVVLHLSCANPAGFAGLACTKLLRTFALPTYGPSVRTMKEENRAQMLASRELSPDIKFCR
jgi:hypothetical protein